MSRYWIIAPFQSNDPKLFDDVWQFDLSNNLISIGWARVGNVSAMDRDGVVDAVDAGCPDSTPPAKRQIAGMLWAFYHEIAPGDTVIARRGRKQLAAVGTVRAHATYIPGRNPLLAVERAHPNFLEVEWHETPRDILFPTIVFPMQTLTELQETRFRQLVEGHNPMPTDLDAREAIEDGSEFVLEKYLEDFIVSNFRSIFKGDLEIYEDEEGNEGQQYHTDEIGTIDILAKDPKKNSFVVIELKKGRTSDRVVGQTLRYMGWVKKNLCTDGETVKGLIVCRDHDPKLSYALEMMKEIDVRYYTVSFKLSDTC
jgi:restriction system protein